MANIKNQADTFLQDVAPYTVVAGNPAKKIKDAPRDTTTAEEREHLRSIADAKD